MNPIHGGDVAGYRLRHSREPLDFSASLNPFGMPPAVREAARRAVGDASAYPDPLCRRLAAALAERLDVPEEFLFFGNGAADVVHRLAQALRPKTALVTAPTFAEYERALAAAGCRTERHRLLRENSFDPGEDILPKISAGLDAVFLCQPNNPTGRLIEPALLAAILERCAAAGTVLIMDECFCHFLRDPERHSLKRLVRGFPNLVILDSFTKLHAMAGIRLGHAISSNTGLLEKLADCGQPWPVSTVAQAAGIAALAETRFVEESLARIHQLKSGLLSGLAALPVDVIGCEANFILFFSPATDLGSRLAPDGIMIRDCANFAGLGPGYFRVAVRLESENRILVEAMAKALNGRK